ncbi:DUF3299 domain-containing protein [Paraferrimonas sp. SM1919]|uniref:DUF3299 domain-containing protein n=1 Tax=Paraferrimonas sp. SM1919 TaxID=2662263 RepID=UPI0013D112E9|nr:DUF3299 domain-containing protein [Paraferrimonas sp. SM1919]
MKKIILASLIAVFSATQLMGCQPNEQTAEIEPKKYSEIEWIELMPKDELELILNPPEEVYAIEDGSSEDNIDSLEALAKGDDPVSQYYAALSSATVIEAFDNVAIKLPGFIVPLAYNKDKKITEFFIVPYFGACLHMPPPPPNQMIYAKIEEGIELQGTTYDPFWFEGTVAIELTEREMGTAAYELKVDTIKPYMEIEEES